ncbi:MAG: protein phosphatase 2C domain-containing protein, partial [Candidatus Saccharibacteria bacterium]|nr:protein phosphatase 2C domain-containing protein [Candidatus Saccharibacteria bacterium]
SNKPVAKNQQPGSNKPVAKNQSGDSKPFRGSKNNTNTSHDSALEHMRGQEAYEKYLIPLIEFQYCDDSGEFSWPHGWAPTAGHVSRGQVRYAEQKGQNEQGRKRGLLSRFFRQDEDSQDEDLANSGNSCEDTALIYSKKLVFGVFDGAGDEFSGKTASQKSSEAVGEYAKNYDIANPDNFVDALQSAKGAVTKGLAEVAKENQIKLEIGGTTAVLVKVDRDSSGETIMHWASVGDSRIYLINGKSVELITKDECQGGNGSVLSNAIDNTSRKLKVEQKGTRSLAPGTIVVLCSDGITGDRGDELLSDEEVREAVLSANSSEEAVENLIKVARKTDDRTAVVFKV